MRNLINVVLILFSVRAIGYHSEWKHIAHQKLCLEAGTVQRWLLWQPVGGVFYQQYPLLAMVEELWWPLFSTWNEGEHFYRSCWIWSILYQTLMSPSEKNQVFAIVVTFKWCVLLPTHTENIITADLCLVVQPPNYKWQTNIVFL